MKKITKISGIIILTAFMMGCSPEVGSKKWCEQMDEAPKGEWTANDAKEYAKNCVFRK